MNTRFDDPAFRQTFLSNRDFPTRIKDLVANNFPTQPFGLDRKALRAVGHAPQGEPVQSLTAQIILEAFSPGNLRTAAEAATSLLETLAGDDRVRSDAERLTTLASKVEELYDTCLREEGVAEDGRGACIAALTKSASVSSEPAFAP